MQITKYFLLELQSQWSLLFPTHPYHSSRYTFFVQVYLFLNLKTPFSVGVGERKDDMLNLSLLYFVYVWHSSAPAIIVF